jgi:hypothetical protein
VVHDDEYWKARIARLADRSAPAASAKATEDAEDAEDDAAASDVPDEDAPAADEPDEGATAADTPEDEAPVADAPDVNADDAADVDEGMDEPPKPARVRAALGAFGASVAGAGRKVGSGVAGASRSVGSGVSGASRKVGSGVSGASRKVGSGVAGASRSVGSGTGSMTQRLREARRHRREQIRAWRANDKRLKREGDRQRIDRVDTVPLAKVAGCYFLCIYLVMLVGCVLIWIVIEGAGLVSDFERFMRRVGFRGFRFEPVQMLLGAALIGLAIVGLLVAFTVLFGAFYNLIAARFGGITVRSSHPSRRSLFELDEHGEWVPGAVATNGSNGNGRESWHTPAYGNGASHDDEDEEALSLPLEGFD